MVIFIEFAHNKGQTRIKYKIKKTSNLGGPVGTLKLDTLQYARSAGELFQSIRSSFKKLEWHHYLDKESENKAVQELDRLIQLADNKNKSLTTHSTDYHAEKEKNYSWDAKVYLKTNGSTFRYEFSKRNDSKVGLVGPDEKEVLNRRLFKKNKDFSEIDKKTTANNVNQKLSSKKDGTRPQEDEFFD